MITVLHLCEHFGGAESSLHGVARAFQWWIPLFEKDHFRIILCSRKAADKAALEMRKSGLNPCCLGYGKHDPRNLAVLLRLIKDEHVDIVHAHGFGASMWARIAGSACRIPVIVHGRANYGSVPWLMRPIERLLGPRTKYAFAVSESTRQFMVQKRHIPSDCVQVLYNGILLDRIELVPPGWAESFRAEQGVQPDEKVLGVVGRIVSHKGHLDVFCAVRQLRERGQNVKLWVVGDGDFLLELEKWVAEHEAEAYIRFLGYRRDVLNVIQCFDLQVFPSHMEGTPNTLYEAMAVGNCIAAAPTDGQGEILEHEKTALMFEVGDSTMMARMVERALSEEGLAELLRRNALARSKDFDGVQCVRTMEQTYERILSL